MNFRVEPTVKNEICFVLCNQNRVVWILCFYLYFDFTIVSCGGLLVGANMCNVLTDHMLCSQSLLRHGQFVLGGLLASSLEQPERTRTRAACSACGGARTRKRSLASTDCLYDWLPATHNRTDIHNPPPTIQYSLVFVCVIHRSHRYSFTTSSPTSPFLHIHRDAQHIRNDNISLMS